MWLFQVTHYFSHLIKVNLRFKTGVGMVVEDVFNSCRRLAQPGEWFNNVTYWFYIQISPHFWRGMSQVPFSSLTSKDCLDFLRFRFPFHNDYDLGTLLRSLVKAGHVIVKGNSAFFSERNPLRSVKRREVRTSTKVCKLSFTESPFKLSRRHFAPNNFRAKKTLWSHFVWSFYDCLFEGLHLTSIQLLSPELLHSWKYLRFDRQFFYWSLFSHPSKSKVRCFKRERTYWNQPCRRQKRFVLRVCTH